MMFPAVEGMMGGTCKIDVEYELLPLKCSFCESLGHAADRCPMKKKVV